MCILFSFVQELGNNPNDLTIFDMENTMNFEFLVQGGFFLILPPEGGETIYKQQHEGYFDERLI